MRFAIALLTASLLLACGGSQARDEAGQPPPEPRDDQSAISEEERLLAAHLARQHAACEAMCERITDCAVADAEQNAPEALEGVDVDALAGEHRRRCTAQCEDSELSVRQVDTVESCTEAEGTCDEFVDCLDAVQPQ
jgi:hypothetical protein